MQQQGFSPSSNTNRRSTTTSNNGSSAMNNNNNGGKFMPQIGLSEFAKLSGDMRASLGLLVENGICKVNGNASLIVMPSTPNYDYKSAGADLLNPLPASAKDIYLRNHGNSSNPSSSASSNPNRNTNKLDDEFFADNWYFVELHQSILQESTHSNERYSNL
ncbi:predicted protein [Naegleria gruberi]|uniref:Predicted protein n=1 Tax=Naegleria gruberi TaxID=5762 RepID=D2W1I0_NAEGR|nr:uncharacterized protein NAEGRDRAFT_53974 [Naegleria gruberi]EFC37094.1 predicted protein [Naegleria gruberi]|eukprot:XP_002669838.1 predicted protein [Naegleria gruberi strain NEG-M]